MSKIEDGGAAFPVMPPCDGMALRDYFAAKAMQALITEPHWPNVDNGLTADMCGALADSLSAQDHYATAAYMLADAMLRARGAKA